MSEPSSLSFRPTLIVGYGTFGLDVLRRLLASASPRGVLRWNAPTGGALPGERSLHDLSLLWVPDRWNLEGQRADDEGSREGSSFEMMRDLYRQVEEVKTEATPEQDLAKAMVAAAEKLLSASARAAHSEPTPLGLDVIVLARPTGPEVIGILDRMMAVGIRHLANNSNLIRAVQGTEALNFSSILDFENYWDHSSVGQRIRRAVLSSVERWQKSRQAGEPSFGRFYLVDGRTKDGIRSARDRIDEISLFLEFLLFEGQRGTFQRLYQSAGGHESPVATFGIRLMERSAGLLSRLAAARFSNGWLDYMANGDGLQAGAEPNELRRRLEPYRPAELEKLLGGAELHEMVDAEVRVLEERMLALEPEDPDWARRLRRVYDEAVDGLRARLSAHANAHMVEVIQGRLASFADDVRAGINADLRDERRPVPLGAVLKEVESALADLETGPEPSPAAGSTAETFRDLERRHGDYLRFNEERLDVEENRQQWWFLVALVLAAALTFPVVDLLESVPEPDPTQFLLVQGRQALHWITNPLGVGLLLFAAAWGLGLFAIAPRIKARVERARRFYKHPARGRFVDRIRGALEPGGALRAPVESFLKLQLSTSALSVRSEVSRELGRIADHLRGRHREMNWLRRQMREFLTMHGLSFDGRHHELARAGRDSAGIRHAVERSEDFERILGANPPGPDRYRSTQASRNPFGEWDAPYSNAFLYPIDFIEDLSKIYKDPILQELAQAGTGPEQERRAREFLEFLRRFGGFDLAFSWKAQEGVPIDQRYCLMPHLWRKLPGVQQELSDLRMAEENVRTGADVARAYLLRVQIGVSPACLLEAGS